MKTNYILFMILICCSASSKAQSNIPKNYISLSGIVEINRTAVGAGLEYERWFFTKDQFAIGGKAQYVFPSKTINYIFSTNEGLERLRQFQLMATSYFFTDPAKQSQGLFLSLGAGINFIKWEMTAYDGSGNTYIRSFTQTQPGFDLGIGGQFKKRRTTSRVTAGYQGFPARKYSDAKGRNISLFYLKISFGF